MFPTDSLRRLFLANRIRMRVLISGVFLTTHLARDPSGIRLTTKIVPEFQADGRRSSPDCRGRPGPPSAHTFEGPRPTEWHQGRSFFHFGSVRACKLAAMLIAGNAKSIETTRHHVCAPPPSKGALADTAAEVAASSQPAILRGPTLQEATLQFFVARGANFRATISVPTVVLPPLRCRLYQNDSWSYR